MPCLVLECFTGRDASPRGAPFPDRRRHTGTTLIESMVVLAVVAILLAGAVPGFARITSTHRASAAVADLVHGIALARSEALKRNRRVYLAPLGARWRDGWAVFVDVDDNRMFDARSDQLIARHDALPASVAVTNPVNPGREPFTDLGAPQRTYILFDGSGYPRQRSGAFNIGSFLVTERTGDVTTIRAICLAAYGRVRVVVDRARCS